MRDKQIKFYTDLLKENEILLLKSTDSFFKNHYIGSPLNVLTNFSGSEGECIIDKNGKITIFVDPRYHILVDRQVFDNIEVVKMPLCETFFEAFQKKYKKNTVLYVSKDINLKEYLTLYDYFDLRTYKLPKKFLKNDNLNIKSPIFMVDSDVSKNDFEYKINKFKKLNSKINKMIIFNLDEISWLTNLRSFQSEYSSNFRSILYVDFVSSSYILFLDKEMEIPIIPKLKVMKLETFPDFINSFNSEIVINYNDVTLENFLSIKKPVQNKKKNLSIISSIREKSEIEYLKECASKVDLAIYNFKNALREGMSEVDLAELFETEIKKTGAIQLSFKTIVSLNENTASIHYSSYDKNKILNKESIILLDCGGYYKNGFATDITRTIYFGNNPKKIYKEVYTNVLRAFIKCFLSNETNARELDLMARKLLEPFYKKGFNFDHGLGHGIGTSVHQNPPRLSMVSKDIIKPYQVHSIEPGLYGKSNDDEFGVRIENCVYSDLNYKKTSLSKFPFEEVLIDYNLLNETEKQFLKNWQDDFKWKK